MSRALRIAVRAATAAGRRVRDLFGSSLVPHRKGEVDLVTAADHAAEEAAVAIVRAAFPDHQVLAEESGRHGPTNDACWILDPLDGTTNFAHGVPHVAVSLALVRQGVVQIAVVHDPLRRETFMAVRGRGASLGRQAARVSTTASLEAGLIATGFPYDRRHHASEYLAYVQRVLARAQGVRRTGSAALDLAYVAAGRFDGFWEWKLAPWDVAAGHLLVQEAGGRVSTIAGTSHTLEAASIVASNGRIHAELLQALGFQGREPWSPSQPS